MYAPKFCYNQVQIWYYYLNYCAIISPIWFKSICKVCEGQVSFWWLIVLVVSAQGRLPFVYDWSHYGLLIHENIFLFIQYYSADMHNNFDLESSINMIAGENTQQRKWMFGTEPHPESKWSCLYRQMVRLIWVMMLDK